MSAGEALFARLDGVTAAGSRIYPLILPQNPTYPAIRYQQISSIRTHAMGQDAPIVRVRMQLDVWGKTYAEARSLAGEVYTQLGRFRGTVAGVEVLDALQDNEIEGYESDSETRRITQDWSLFLRLP